MNEEKSEIDVWEIRQLKESLYYCVNELSAVIEELNSNLMKLFEVLEKERNDEDE